MSKRSVLVAAALVAATLFVMLTMGPVWAGASPSAGGLADPTGFASGGVSKDATPPVVTRLSVRPSKSLVSYGAIVWLTGSLVASDTSSPLPGRTVIISRSFDSSVTWSPCATVPTAGDGSYAATSALSQNTRFRAAYAGGVGEDAAMSSGVVVYSRAKFSATTVVSTRRPANRLRRNVPFIVSGFVRPRHTSSVKVYLYRYVRRWNGRAWVWKWVLTRAKVVPLKPYLTTGLSRFAYRSSVTLTGYWFARVYHYDASHAGTYGTDRIFKVLP